MENDNGKNFNKNWLLIVSGILLVLLIALIVLEKMLLVKENNTENIEQPKIKTAKYEKKKEQLEDNTDSQTDETITEEIEDLNFAFIQFEGEQTGAMVMTLINRLKSNAKLHEIEPFKIPCVSYNTHRYMNDRIKELSKQAYGVEKENEIDGYLRYLNEISSGIQLEHRYYIAFTKSKNGLIRGITINYFGLGEEEYLYDLYNFQVIEEDEEGLYGIRAIDSIDAGFEENEEITAGIKHSMEKNTENKKNGEITEEKREPYIYNMSTFEIEGFNSTFITYRGEQMGSQVKALLNRLVEQVQTYCEEPSLIPCVSYNTNYVEDKLEELSNQAYGVEKSNETKGYFRYINTISEGLDLKHKYTVGITINDQGIVRGITINYYSRNEDMVEEDYIFENFQQSEGNEQDLYGIKAIDSINTELKEDEEITAGIKHSNV